MKSRNQSLNGFLESLQLEYIMCSIRKKIYTKSNDKKYYQKTLNYKKEKIDDIAERNGLKTIFNDDEVKKDFEFRILKEKGFPQFIYKNDEERETIGYNDLKQYYKPGSEVRISTNEDSNKVGIIAKSYVKKGVVHVKLKGDEEVQPFHIDNVTRIF